MKGNNLARKFHQDPANLLSTVDWLLSTSPIILLLLLLDLSLWFHCYCINLPQKAYWFVLFSQAELSQNNVTHNWEQAHSTQPTTAYQKSNAELSRESTFTLKSYNNNLSSSENIPFAGKHIKWMDTNRVRPLQTRLSVIICEKNVFCSTFLSVWA